MDGGKQGGHPAGGEKDHRDAEPRVASRGQGDGGESQTTYYGDRILEPIMNASISATAYLGNAPAPNLSRWYARYMGDIVTNTK